VQSLQLKQIEVKDIQFCMMYKDYPDGYFFFNEGEEQKLLNGGT